MTANAPAVDAPTTAILVGCVSRKRSTPSPARDLYTSPLFRGRRRHAEATGCPWLILSALYGVVAPDELLDPYDLRLAGLPAAERRRWGERVAAQLEQRLGDLHGARLEVHAGEHYVAAIESPLHDRGATITRPLAGLPLGRQLQWYASRGRPP